MNPPFIQKIMNQQIMLNLWTISGHPWFQNKEVEKRISSDHFSIRVAHEAEENWITTVRNKQATGTTPVFKLESPLSIMDLLIQSHMVSSKNEVRRLLKDGAIRLDGEKILKESLEISKEGVLRIGKKKLLQIIL